MPNLTNIETICALSTPPGTGGIAVIRVSGPDAFPKCDGIFKSADKAFSITNAVSHTIHLGMLGKDEEFIDEVLVSIFRSPHSYTGEDVVEISCHEAGRLEPQQIFSGR